MALRVIRNNHEQPVSYAIFVAMFPCKGKAYALAISCWPMNRQDVSGFDVWKVFDEVLLTLSRRECRSL
jgi:hypothetical protein